MTNVNPDRWSAFTKREQMDIHHALRMLLKYPGLGSDERGPLSSLADEIWNRHAEAAADLPGPHGADCPARIADFDMAVCTCGAERAL